MPGSTGPDLNTYSIPEVQLGDTFNFWKDATNTAIYKLNKLKIYDMDTTANSASLGATYTTAGVWTAYLQPTVTSGHTFTSLIRFTGGISAGGGFTLGGNAWIAGGVSLSGALTVGGAATLNGNVVLGDAAADTITANGVFGGLTASGEIRANGGLTASALDVSGVSKFVGSGSFVGGLSASALYASAGSTFASNLHVGGGFTANGNTVLNGQLNLAGTATINNALVVSAGTQLGGTLTVLGPSVLLGTTASTLDVSGAAKVVGGLSASALYASKGSTFATGVKIFGTQNYGSAANSGILTVGNANNSRQINFGVSDTNSVVWIEGWVPGVGGSHLVLQPIGGYVGIGITAPVANLDVAGGNSQVWIRAGSGGGFSASAGAGLKLEYVSTDNTAKIQAYDYSTSTAKTLSVNGSGGNVGIGLASPAVALDVNGEARSSTSTTAASADTTLTTKDYVDSVAIGGVGYAYTVYRAVGADVISGRASGIVYRNTTGKPIQVMIRMTTITSGNDGIYCSSAASPTRIWYSPAINDQQTITFIVPPNFYYKCICTTSNGIYDWNEMRA